MAREGEGAEGEKGTPPSPPRGGDSEPPRVWRRTQRHVPSPEREKELTRIRQVTRPVALLELIGRLQSWSVSDDMIAAAIEAAEAGVDIDSLYEGKAPEEAVKAEERQAERAAAPIRATPMPVYRLGDDMLIHFSREGKPIGPPVQHLFVSRLGSEGAFGCELLTDAMVANAPPYFKKGDILVFSTERKVESGDLVFVKTRGGDEFTQIFFAREDQVRVRPLNPDYPERQIRRFEIKVMCKLIGRYQEL